MSEILYRKCIFWLHITGLPVRLAYIWWTETIHCWRIWSVFSVQEREGKRWRTNTRQLFKVCHKIHRDAFIITLSNTVCRIYLDCTETIILIQTEEIFQFPIQILKPKDLWDPSSSAHTNWVIHVIQKSNQLGTEEPPLDMIQVWRCGEAQTESLD